MAKSKHRKKKKGKSSQPSHLSDSPEKKFKERVRKLPLSECWINSEWKEAGMALLFVSREHINGNRSFSSFQIDVWGYGLKDCFYEFNHFDFERLVNNQYQKFEICSYEFAYNLVTQAIHWSEKHGFRIPPEAKTASFIFEQDNSEIDYIPIKFGKNGQPVIIETDLDTEFDEDDDEEWDDDDDWDEDEESDDQRYAEEDSEDFIDPQENPYQGFTEEEIRTEAFDLLEEFVEGPTFKYSKIELAGSAFELFDAKFGRSEFIEIPEREERLKSDLVTLEPHEADTGFPVPRGEENETTRIFKLMNANVEKAVSQLEMKIKEFPDYPVYYNNLRIAYMFAKRVQDADIILQECCRRFPEYFFSRVEMTLKNILSGELNNIPLIWNGKYFLTEVYPTRNCFHLGEVINFYSVMAWYFAKLENFPVSDYYSAIVFPYVDVGFPMVETSLFEIAKLKVDKIILS